MNLDITKLNATVEAAKAKAPASWSAKIDKAASMAPRQGSCYNRQ